MTIGVTERSNAPVLPRTTGSVYLDAPRPSRYRTLPRRRAHTTRTVAATILGALGLLALSAAALLAGVRTIATDPDRVVDAIGSALDEPVARDELETEIADAIEHNLVGDEVTTAVAGFGIDVRAEAAAVAVAVLDDPAFRAALDDLIAEVHHRMLVDPRPGDVDLTPLTQAAVGVIEAESPVLASVIPENGALATIEADAVPDLTRGRDLLDQGLSISLLLALALPLAAAVHPRRHRLVAWTGRWLLAAGLAAGVAAVSLPYLGGRLTGWTTVEAAIRTTSLRLLAPAAIFGIVGTGMITVASVAKSRERRKVSDEGAAAALGVDEPPLRPVTASPELELSRRGLVDGGQRLTNI